MEGKNESKHTPGKWVEGHGLMSPQEMVAALLEENKRLEKGLEQTQIDYYENKIESVIRNEMETQAEVERLTKEKSELVEVLRELCMWVESCDYAPDEYKAAKDLLTRIK